MTTAPQLLTFGCRLNMYELEVMRQHAAAAGLVDAIIVNTCAVTAEAERQARQSIRRARRERPDARIIVTGCAAQIDPAKFSEMPEVDHVIGNDRKMDVEAFRELGSVQGKGYVVPPPLRGRLGGGLVQQEQSFVLAETPPARGGGLVRHARQDGDLQRAFVQVQNGCDHRCTFCIIPYGRGASRSVPVGAVVEQTRTLVEQGYREIVFTGVDIASYGGDLPGKPGLGQMIRRVLALVPELPRLRLSSLDPAAMDEDLWRLIAGEPRLMPHLHLSLQAGDDMILKRMKRRHLRGDVIALCERARRLRPDIAFGADIIAGFPTEDEAMFQNTFDLVEQCGFTWLHVFPYSARKGTPAARMPQLNGAIRRERAERLRSLDAKAVGRHMAALAGQTFAVLVERQGLGCTRQFAKVKLLGDAPLGEIVEVECLGVEDGQAVTRLTSPGIHLRAVASKKTAVVPHGEPGVVDAQTRVAGFPPPRDDRGFYETR